MSILFGNENVFSSFPQKPEAIFADGFLASDVDGPKGSSSRDKNSCG